MNRQTGIKGSIFFLARLTCPVVLLCVTFNAMAAGVSFDHGFVEFDDAPLEEPLAFPDWFKLSFLDLREDIGEVREAGKQGLIVYFGQKYCAYCKQFLEVDLEAGDIQSYLREHFDIIGIDIHGDRTVTDLQGRELTESALAIRDKTNFTPSVDFLQHRRERRCCACVAIIRRIVFVRHWNMLLIHTTRMKIIVNTWHVPMCRWCLNPVTSSMNRCSCRVPICWIAR